jgi:hypothetical protein
MSVTVISKVVTANDLDREKSCTYASRTAGPQNWRRRQ